MESNQFDIKNFDEEILNLYKLVWNNAKNALLNLFCTIKKSCKKK